MSGFFLPSLAALLAVAATAPGQARDPVVPAPAAPAGLPETYRKWLEDEVPWIITDREREEFRGLPTDTERDAFIARFWRLRDLQPLTAENEFKDEHYRRLRHADRHLGTDSPRPGAQTDRGRVYILLGKPTDVERVVSANEVYPYELWFYGSVPPYLGLPGQIRLIFYRAHGVGEYRLLNPALERDRLFPPSSQIAWDRYDEVRFALGDETARALDSVAPGYGVNSSAEIVHELVQPRSIPERIQARGLALHPEVHTRFSLERLDVGLAVMVVPGDDGSARVHLGAGLPAREVSFQEVEKDRYLARVDVFGEVTDERGLVVARFDQAATLALGKDDLEARRGNAFAFEAVRSLVPGRYRVTLFLQDYGKGKLAQAETEVEVPAAGHGPRLDPVTFAFRADRAPAVDSDQPFVAAGFKLYSRPRARYLQGERVMVFALLHDGPKGDIEVTLRVGGGDRPAFAETARAGAHDGLGPRPLLLALPTAGLSRGRHLVEVSVAPVGGEPVATASARIEIGDEPVPPGYFLYRERRDLPPEVEHYNRGIQLLSAGDVAGAQRHFRIALDHRRNFTPASVYLARTLILSGKPDEAAPLLAAVLERDPQNADALVTRGSLELAGRRFDPARDAFRRALDAGATGPELLNGLAEASLGLGDVAAARSYLSDSLALDPNQEGVRRRYQSLETGPGGDAARPGEAP